MMLETLAEGQIWQMVAKVFVAGLATGAAVFLSSLGISHAMKIFKTIT